MKKWTYPMIPLNMGEILAAVKDKDWQVVRKSMKGVPTEQKLDILEGYYERRNGNQVMLIRIQVCNYINALKRGGQLNDALEVVR